MEKDKIQSFIDNYSQLDFDKIKFDWNGKHADDFIDKNIDFRTEVCEYLIPQIDKVNLELIRDLYLEQAKCAKETWGVYRRFNLLGQELLARGCTKYVMDYLAGASKSQDTYMMSGSIQLDRQKAADLLNYLKERLQTEIDDLNRKLIEQLGLRRFEWLSKK